MTIPEAFQLALQHHQAGRQAEAENIYRQILAVQPENPDALHLLGVIAHQVGRHDVAVDLIRQAIALIPNHAAFHSNLGSAYLALGRFDEAISACHSALRLDDGDPVTHQNLGIALRSQGRLDEAVIAYRRALELQPADARVHCNLGVALSEQGHLDEAIACYQRALQLRENDPVTHNNLGNSLSNRGRLDEAIVAFRRALALRPDLAETQNNLGNALREKGRPDEAITAYLSALRLKSDLVEAHCHLGNALSDLGRFDEAIGACRRALELRPDYAEAHNNLGNALRDKGRVEEAIGAYRQAIFFRPAYAGARNNIGTALRDKFQLDEAIIEYRSALELDPDYAEAHNNLGSAFKDQGRMGEAVESYRRSVELKPGAARLHSNLVYSALFDPGFNARELREENARWQQHHGAPLERWIRPHTNPLNHGRRLRVGYVSPDFWHHVICHFLVPLLEAHGHAEFEIYCYASVKRADAITERMRKNADVWRDVRGVSDEALAEMIRADGIDILVDLTQHMADNRLLVFARKPAPVQVAWLGYPGSTGLRTMDYRLTDSHMEPEGSEWSESVEKAVRLPDSWFCFDPIDEFPEPGDLPALRAGRVTFGCLNNFCKVNDAVLERWAKVMNAVEGSRLLLRCPAGSTQDRVRQFFEGHSIGTERLELVAWTATRAEFLALLERMDIALDPFPYNGGTTTCEALWMGIPVLTLPENSIVSRIGLSILTACGMPEFLAQTEEAFMKLAKDLAGDLPRLAELRRTLRARMKSSPFMDAPRFARNVEKAYHEMWRAWCAKHESSARV